MKRLPKTFAMASSQLPSSKRLCVSYSNVEKVVYDPTNPMQKKKIIERLWGKKPACRRGNTKPRANDPVMFTRNVP
jgi:hypothetical protein